MPTRLWYPTGGGKARLARLPSFPGYGLVTTAFVGGKVRKFDDLPDIYRANIDPQMPLDGRKAGGKPPMTEGEISDLVCFLETLNDGYEPPVKPRESGPCVD